MPANYSLNFDFGTCSVGPLGRGKKPSRLQQMLGDDPFENSLVEQMSLINKAIFQAPAPSYSKSAHPWSPADCVWLDSMAGYHFPAVFVRCKRGPATRTVVHCHANACDVGHIYELCQRDAECWRANVLLVEYPGYGASPGVPYERSVDRHVMVAYAYLVEELRLNPESIVLFGRSLGSGPVCRLAQRLQELGEKVGGVILHSPFVSVREVGLSLLGPVAHVMSDRWDNASPLAALRCRLLIIHGASDEVVPFTHAERLRDVRVKHGLHVTFFPTQGTHNYFSYYRDYLHPVENFLEGHKARALPPLPDPLPRAKYSKAQVKEIMELRRKKTEERPNPEEHVTASTAQRSRSRRDATRDVARLLGRSDDLRRDGSPNSTLVDGGANESGPTSSDDDEDIAGKKKTQGTRAGAANEAVKDVSDAARLMSLSSPEVNATHAGRTPGPRRERWSKAKGRVADGQRAADARENTEKRRSFERSGGYLDDDFVAERVPGGASPFGVKKTAAGR